MNNPNTPIAILAYRNNKPNRQSYNDWQNRPQTYSLITGCFIFMSAGMNLAMSLGWNLFTPIPNTKQFMLAWFIGSIVGCLASLALVKYIQKRFFMIVSGLMILTSGIIFTSVLFNLDALMAARYLNGFGIGFATVPYLMHAGEIATNSNRGQCLSFEQYTISVGIAIQVIYSSEWAWGMSFDANRVHGIIDIIFAVFALATIPLMIESPIFHLRKNNEDAALESHRRLQRPHEITPERRALFEELKAYVQQNEKHSLGEDLSDSLAPLLKMMLYRGMVAFSFSLPLSVALELSYFVSIGSLGVWPPIVYGVLRLLGALVGLCLVDCLGRKLSPIICLLLMAALATGIAVIFSTPRNLLDPNEMSVSCALSLLQQLFAGAFVPSTSVYLGEAFPLNSKAYCMGICVVFENLIHIVVICTFGLAVYREVYVYCMFVAVIMYVSVVLFCVTLPETKNQSLHEAARRFKCWLHLKCT